MPAKVDGVSTGSPTVRSVMLIIHSCLDMCVRASALCGHLRLRSLFARLVPVYVLQQIVVRRLGHKAWGLKSEINCFD